MPTAPLVHDVYGHIGRSLMEDHLRERMKAVPVGGPTTSSAPTKPSTTYPVGILGAGAGGLYTAMILEDLGIPHKIIEAQGDVGGRLYTHHFNRDIGAPFNYFDIGAMRFPKTDSMNRLFNLFNNPKLNTPDIALGSRIKPFYFVGLGNNNTLFSYNGITIRQSNPRGYTKPVVHEHSQTPHM